MFDGSDIPPYLHLVRHYNRQEWQEKQAGHSDGWLLVIPVLVVICWVLDWIF